MKIKRSRRKEVRRALKAAQPLLKVAADLREKFIPHLPERHESCAVTLDAPRTAALRYDRVWLPTQEGPAGEIAFHGSTALEANAYIASFLIDTMLQYTEAQSEPRDGWNNFVENFNKAATELIYDPLPGGEDMRLRAAAGG
jgi:hypothetical protein